LPFVKGTLASNMNITFICLISVGMACWLCGDFSGRTMCPYFESWLVYPEKVSAIDFKSYFCLFENKNPAI